MVCKINKTVVLPHWHRLKEIKIERNYDQTIVLGWAENLDQKKKKKEKKKENDVDMIKR